MEEEKVVYHVPALLQPCMDALDIKPDGVYVDVTFGGGGHSREIMRRLGKKGRLLGFDQDEDALQNALDDSRFTFVRGNFCYLSNFLKYYGVEQVDGILADLGVSFHHFDDPERGFSFRFDGKLDMRMNQKASITAADLIENYSEEQLSDVFYLYGELSNARKLAAAIVPSEMTTISADKIKSVRIAPLILSFSKATKSMLSSALASRRAVCASGSSSSWGSRFGANL